MDIQSAKHIHFTGIKGVGMTSIALCAQDLGATISGSDVKEEFVTDSVLKNRKIPFKSNFSTQNIPTQTDLLIYTGAHQGENNVEVKHAKSQNISVISHAEAVGQLMKGKIGISVCGVGGKTTTSSMIATILEELNQNPSYSIGVAAINNLNSPGKYDRTSKHLIAEADEYIVSPGSDNTPRFLLQKPQIIVCTNIAHDHPDVYPTQNDIIKAYVDFFNTLSPTDVLIANVDSLPLAKIVKSWKKSKLVTFGSASSVQWQVVSVIIKNQTTTAQIKTPQGNKTLTLKIPGQFNIMNAVAAIIAAHNLGLSLDKSIFALSKFTGTKRRFERVGEKDNILYYDDYAHHPSEIRATIKAAKLWFPNKTIKVAFQPHTFSRTKKLFTKFTQSFSQADEIWFTDIYASAREKPDPNVSSQKLEANTPRSQYVGDLKSLVKYARQHLKQGDVFLTLGAGDIYKIHQQLLNA